MKPKLLLILAVILLIFPLVHAEISSFNLEFTISIGKVYVTEEVNLQEKGDFNVELPEDATEISVFVDGNKQETPGSEIFKVNGKKIIVSYLTKQFIDKKNFVIDFTYPDDIKNLSIALNIPSNMELSRPVAQKTLASNAIFPKASSITTDGQRIKIIWERENVATGDSISMLVMLKERVDYSFLIYIIIAIAVAAVIFVLAKKPRIKTIVKTRTARIEEHLKEDEEQIVRILKSRENQCEQGTLRVITGFSKAKLSGLLKELEDRKIIYKEKRGKKNIVFLK